MQYFAESLVASDANAVHFRCRFVVPLRSPPLQQVTHSLHSAHNVRPDQGSGHRRTLHNSGIVSIARITHIAHIARS